MKRTGTDARVALQNRTLSIQWAMVGLFPDQRIDDDVFRHQALRDDAHGERRGNHALLLALFAGTLLALGQLGELLGGLDAE